MKKCEVLEANTPQVDDHVKTVASLFDGEASGQSQRFSSCLQASSIRHLHFPKDCSFSVRRPIKTSVSESLALSEYCVRFAETVRFCNGHSTARCLATMEELMSRVRLQSDDTERHVIRQLDSIESKLDQLSSLSRRQVFVSLPSESVRSAAEAAGLFSVCSMLLIKVDQCFALLDKLNNSSTFVGKATSADSAAQRYAAALQWKLQLDALEGELRMCERRVREFHSDTVQEVQNLLLSCSF